MIVRPIRSDDKELLARAHARLSAETVYRRYLTAKPRLTAGDLSYLTEVDGRDHAALVALPASGPRRIVAVARYVRDSGDPSIAEFAIVVGDRYQRRGLGSELARLVAERARGVGIRRLRTVVLAENSAARRLVHRIAEGLASESGSGAAREIVVRLAA